MPDMYLVNASAEQRNLLSKKLQRFYDKVREINSPVTARAAAYGADEGSFVIQLGEGVSDFSKTRPMVSFDEQKLGKRICLFVLLTQAQVLVIKKQEGETVAYAMKLSGRSNPFNQIVEAVRSLH